MAQDAAARCSQPKDPNPAPKPQTQLVPSAAVAAASALEEWQSSARNSMKFIYS